MNPNENNPNENTENFNPSMPNNQQPQNNIEVNYKDNEVEASVKMPIPEKHTGGTIGAVIIVIILIVGGLYFWGKQINNNAVVDGGITAEEIISTVDTKTNALENQGTSDTVTSIEKDLNVTNLDGLDAELGNIGAELNF